MYYPTLHVTTQAPSRTEILLPAFSYENTWLGVSDLLATWSVNNTTEFSLKLPIDAPSETFVLCVSWTADSVTYRFKLWEGGVLHYPIYNGERIGASAKLEVWSTEYDTAELEDDLTLYTSWLTEPEVCMCTCDADLATVITEGTTAITEDEDGGDEDGGGDSDPFLAIQGYVELRSLTGYVNNQFAYLEFGNVAGDGQGGDFVFDSSEGVADDGADYIKPNDIPDIAPGRWVRQNNP